MVSAAGFSSTAGVTLLTDNSISDLFSSSIIIEGFSFFIGDTVCVFSEIGFTATFSFLGNNSFMRSGVNLKRIMK